MTEVSFRCPQCDNTTYRCVQRGVVWRYCTGCGLNWHELEDHKYLTVDRVKLGSLSEFRNASGFSPGTCR